MDSKNVSRQSRDTLPLRVYPGSFRCSAHNPCSASCTRPTVGIGARAFYTAGPHKKKTGLILLKNKLICWQKLNGLTGKMLRVGRCQAAALPAPLQCPYPERLRRTWSSREILTFLNLRKFFWILYIPYLSRIFYMQDKKNVWLPSKIGSLCHMVRGGHASYFFPRHIVVPIYHNVKSCLNLFHVSLSFHVMRHNLSNT